MIELRAAILCVLVQRISGLYDAVNHIESARLYGNIDYYAYYFVDLLIGTPPQRVSVILDTGSSVAAFPCASCDHCGKHIDPNFDIAKSTTAKWVACGRSCKGNCRKGKCAYYQGYQEGSSISGFWFSDWVRLGDGIQRNPPVFAKVGCHYNENKLFYTQKANGIMGIRGAGNMLENLFAHKEHVNSRVFSICLAEWGGRLVVGGHNVSYHKGEIQWTGVQPHSYGVDLNSMKIAGSTKSITGFRRTIIDSGTTYTYTSSGAYRSLKSGIETYCKNNQDCGATKSGDKCYKIGKANLSNFPDVNVYFKGANTIWEPRGYLYRKGTSNTWCYSFADDGARASTVLGASWMLYQEIIFDMQHNKVGIVKAACPEYRDRPEHTTANLPPNGVAPNSTGAGTPKAKATHFSRRVKMLLLLCLAIITVIVVIYCARQCSNPAKHMHMQLDQDDDTGMTPQIVGSAKVEVADADRVGGAREKSEKSGDMPGAGLDPLGSPVHSTDLRSWPEPRKVLPSGEGPLE